jgi:nicotinamide-nucleotide amidase
MTELEDGALAAELLEALAAQQRTLAVAESLTGGLVAATLVDVPGASRVLRGGVVAYATEVKHLVLDVDADLLAEHGAVHPEVARQMARGVRLRLRADIGLATTGVAGPDPQDGHAPGTVFVAVSTAEGERVRELAVDGGRAEVRAVSRDAVLALALVVARGDVGATD